jgi:hypothetical protein
VKSRDSKGHETAFYWETAVDEKVFWAGRGGGGKGGCVAAQALTDFYKGSLDAC